MLPDKANVLIVEGEDDKYCVIELMAFHVAWPEGKHNAPVNVEVGRSVDEILDEAFINAYLKSPPIKKLGVLIDADDNAKGRYQKLRKFCLQSFPMLPEDLPAEGVVVTNGEKKLGIWIMPNNAAEGYLEGFLKHLVPDRDAPLWKLAVESVDAAFKLGARVKTAHRAKANLHTWLAWQDPPGDTFGRALLKKALDPHCDYAKPFVGWFKNLYELKELGT